MTYMNAELELVKFDTEDVLATSANETTKCGNGEDYEGEEDPL